MPRARKIACLILAVWLAACAAAESGMSGTKQDVYDEGLVFFYAKDYPSAIERFGVIPDFLDSGMYTMYCQAMVFLQMGYLDSAQAYFSILSVNEFLDSEAMLHYAYGRKAEQAGDIFIATDEYALCLDVMDASVRTFQLMMLFDAIPTIESAEYAGGAYLIKWRCATDADAYRVYVSEGFGMEYLRVGETADTSFTYAPPDAYEGRTLNVYLTAVYNADHVFYNTMLASAITKWHARDGAWRSDSRYESPLSRPYALSVQKSLAAPVLTSLDPVSNGVMLAWGAVEGAQEYRVYRALGDSSHFALLSSTQVTVFTDSKAIAGVDYSYRVSAVRDGIESEQSAPGRVNLSLAAPRILVKYDEQAGAVRVSWLEVVNADSYGVCRSSGGDYIELHRGRNTEYVDYEVEPGKSYDYIVYAYNGASASEPSEYKSASVPRILRAPQPRVTALDESILLEWDSIEDARLYKVYRSLSLGDTGTLLDSVIDNIYRDDSAKFGVTYYYRLQAVNNETASEYSAQARGQLTLESPRIQTMSSTYGDITISWTEVDLAQYYRVYRSDNPTSNGSLVATVHSAGYYTDSYELKWDKTYYYRVSAVREEAESELSRPQIAALRSITAALSSSSRGKKLSNKSVSVQASSNYPNSKDWKYEAISANDSNRNTSWVEGVSGNGAGETISFMFAEADVVGFIIEAGRLRTNEMFWKNTRPKEILVYAEGTPKMPITLGERMGDQTVLFSTPIRTTYLTIELSTFYTSGTVGEDTCITDVWILVE